MARLPQIGGDQGNWGQILNDYLSVEHNADGTLKKAADIAAKYEKPANGIPAGDLSSATQSSLTKADTAVQSVNAKFPTSGNVTLTASDVSAIPTSQKGQASGVAELDTNGKLVAGQTPDHLTSAALASTIATNIDTATAALTDGTEMMLGAANTSRTVVATGHSLFYGQDTSASGTTAATNGASQTRSSSPTTSDLAIQAGYLSTGTTVLVNQTYPGDRTAEGLTRWASGSSGDIEFFWLDTNDAKNYASYPSGPLAAAQSATNITALAQRARTRGASFVVIGGAPVLNTRDSWRIFASSQAQRQVCERLGGRFIDVGELLGDYADTATSYWTDSVHLRPAAYSLIGARLAALLGPKGTHPPTVAPGRVFTWRDQVITGGTITNVSSTSSIGDNVLRLSAGATAGLSFDATAPVVPVVTVRHGTSDAVVGLYTNLATNRTPVWATIDGGTNVRTSVIVGRPILSPGPAGFVVRAESGVIDIIQVEFISPETVRTVAYGGGRLHDLPSVGGSASNRADASWDSGQARFSGVALRSGQGQATIAPRRWLFDVRLGSNNSGITLLEGVANAATSISDGLLIFRSGSNLIIRAVTDGATSDTTYASSFAASGIVGAIIEVSYVSSGDLLIYLDGSLKHTITGFVAKWLISGVIAGTAASGAAYASGKVIVY